MRLTIHARVAVLAIICASLIGCHATDGTDSVKNAADSASMENEGLPKVLIIGDSISIGYFPPVKELLKDTAEVYHNAGNAQHTAHGLAQLDAWLGDTSWDVIHFNHGLHDLKYVNERGERVPPGEGHQMIPIEQYVRNLEELVKRLKATGAELICATTTPVPEGASGRIKGDSERYNREAVRIMRRHGIPVNDLYGFALSRLDAIQRPHDVHFTPEGSRLLAEQVAQRIRVAIAKR